MLTRFLCLLLPLFSASALAAESHTDFSLTLGVVTPGVGIHIGHRADHGFRAEVGAGTLVVAHSGYLGLGAAPRVYSGDSYLEIPLLTSVSRIQCPDCGTDGASSSTTWLQFMSGLDWVNPGAEGGGWVLSCRVGYGPYYSESTYSEESHGWGISVPSLQLGIGLIL